MMVHILFEIRPFNLNGVSYKITVVCLWIPHNYAERGLRAAKKHEPVSITVAVFRVSHDLPDRQLFCGIECNCSGVREGTLKGFQQNAGMRQNMLDIFMQSVISRQTMGRSGVKACGQDR